MRDSMLILPSIFKEDADVKLYRSGTNIPKRDDQAEDQKIKLYIIKGV